MYVTGGYVMIVYLIDKNTNEVIRQFSNVLSFNITYVEYLNNGCRGKIYCDTETEYISETIPK